MSGQYDEGHTIAGWAGFAIATVGTGVAAFGIVLWSPALWLGLAVIVAAAVLTWVLHLTGWGKPPGPRPAAQWGMRTRDRSARGGHRGCRTCQLSGRGPGPIRTTATTPGPEPTPGSAIPTQERTSAQPISPPISPPVSPAPSTTRKSVG